MKINANIIILALPAQSVPSWLTNNKDLIDPKTLICNTAKGLYLQEKQLLSEAVKEALGRDQPYCILSGTFFLMIISVPPYPKLIILKFEY